MKKITFLAALFAVFAMNAQVTVWEDSFESYFDFETVAIGDYTQIDIDGNTTYGSTTYDFANEGYTGTAIVMNPSMTTPDASGDAAWQVRTGDKGLWMFAATSNPNGTAANDDYIITPAINLTGATGSNFSMWAKSVTADFGLERFEVLLSTTGTDVADFTENLSGGVQEAPVDVYTEYSYDISAYDGNVVYIAIHYLALDSFILQMDDFLVEATTLGVGDESFSGFIHAIDNDNNLRLTANTPMESVQLFNVLGQQVANQKLSTTNESVSLSSLKSGVYIATVTIGGQSKTFKIIRK